MAKVTVLGGGTGSFVVLSGLKHIPNISLTAIVPATDSGGSTGRLRDEFGLLPVGDVRQCLVALAADTQDELLLRDLFSYRFAKGTGLIGHSFGNLFLTALSDMLGSELAAIQAAKQLLKIKGDVLPVSDQQLNLIAEYADGTSQHGEHHIDEPTAEHNSKLHIDHLSVQPSINTYPAVTEAIVDADLILLSPGDLYTSLLANVVVPGVADALQQTPAQLVYVVNLMTKHGQTYRFNALDHVLEVEKYVGRKLDHILVNNTFLSEDLLNRYAAEHDFPVEDNLGNDPRVIRADLLDSEEIVTVTGDVLKRSLIRHSGDKIAAVVNSLLG